MTKNRYLAEVRLLRDSVPSFDEYPFSLAAVRHFDALEFDEGVTFFVGENGSGKSTLLEAIAVALGLNPEGGTRNFRFGTRDSHSALHDYLRVSRTARKPTTTFFLRAESFFNVATEIERLDSEPSFGPPVINAYGGRSLHEQSHGEAFLALMMNRFSAGGLYLLDEPEAALSPQRQLSALAITHDLVKNGSQFVIATHSPILLAFPGATIYRFDVDGVSRVEYKDTEHYQVMHDFMVNPDRMLRTLLNDD